MQRTLISVLMMLATNATSLRPGEVPIDPTAPKPTLHPGEWRQLNLNHPNVQKYPECVAGTADQKDMEWSTDDHFKHFIDYETKLTTAGYGSYYLPVLSDARDAWVGMTLIPSEDETFQHGAFVQYTGEKEVTYNFEGTFEQKKGKGGFKTYADHFDGYTKFALVSRWFDEDVDKDALQDAEFVVLPFAHISKLETKEILDVDSKRDKFLDNQWEKVHDPKVEISKKRSRPTLKTGDFQFEDGTKLSLFTKQRKALDAQEERDDKKRLEHFQKYPDLAKYLESWIPIPSKWTTLRYSAMAIAAIFMTIWIIRLPFRIIGL